MGRKKKQVQEQNNIKTGRRKNKGNEKWERESMKTKMKKRRRKEKKRKRGGEM